MLRTVSFLPVCVELFVVLEVGFSTFANRSLTEC